MHSRIDSVFLDRLIAGTPGFPAANVTLNGTNGSRELNVGVADTPETRAMGMRNALPDANQAALLMSWPYDKTVATLSNANVPIPVHASFYGADGQHVGQFSMAAGDSTPMTAPAPHKYALELHQDWADALGIGPGCSINPL